MSTHPNVLLILDLIPNKTSRATMRAILEEMGLPPDHDDDLKIGGDGYHFVVSESDYEDSYQISTTEGNILVFDLITYGYGESVEWAALVAQKEQLEEWARGICERHNCTHKIRVSANYW